MDIPGYEYYYVQEDGRVFHKLEGEVETYTAMGKVYVNLELYNHPVKHPLAMLVAQAFLGAVYTPKTIITHIDNNPCNNHKDNLHVDFKEVITSHKSRYRMKDVGKGTPEEVY